ncbi:hypothetical protein [uncultured Tessaracoccus sp.]|uniref:hypothetical protein n=1 Tax=uncultured Tessaracoccus sp. TaxID=905023 RepID=UPI00260659DD|nr:hypothetical protein [uncultured Tessaracoccus sp.]
MLANCAEVYARCDNANRCLRNQAFFTRIYIDEDEQLRVQNNGSFEMLLDPETNTNALIAGFKTATRPEPKPPMMAKVRALCVEWS